MSILRTEEFKQEGSGMFDEYFESSAFPQRIMKRFIEERVYAPAPVENLTITKDDVQDVTTADPKTIYVLLYKNELTNLSDKKVLLYVDDNGVKTIKQIADTNIFCVNTEENPDLFFPNEVTKINEEDYGKFEEEKNKKEIEKYITANTTARMTTLKRDVQEKKRRLNEMKVELRRIAKTYEEMQIQLVGLEDRETSNKEEVKKLLGMLEEIKSSPNIRNVTFAGNEIVFLTNDISIIDECENVRPIGRFKVTLNINTVSLKIINEDNKINKEKWNSQKGGESFPQHPHVDATGHPCLGTLEVPLAEVCLMNDIAQAWQLIHSYLTSFNSNDIWGRRLRFWNTEDNKNDAPITDATEECCSICGEELEGDGYVCSECGAALCENCATFTDNEDVYCDICREKHYCDCCEAYHDLNVTLHTCPDCGETFCDCNDDAYEGKSGDLYCCYDCANNANDLRDEDEIEDDDEDEWEE